MSEYIIYVGHDKRIVHVTKNSSTYVPVIFEKILFYYLDSLPPEDPYYNYTIVRVNDKYEYQRKLDITDYITKAVEKQKHIINLLESLNDFSRFYLRAYETNYVSRYMNFYLYEEIDTYDKTGEAGTILKSLQEFESGYSIDDVVSREKLKKEDVKNMLSYLNTVENVVRKMIREEKYEKAKVFITKERGKTGW